MTPEIASFKKAVWDYYGAHSRRMPWRDNPSPYFVLVSEMMLQQTQVARVMPKFLSFIGCFPTIQALAQAPLSDVLAAWSGLGYNRRAKFLHEAAKCIVAAHSSHVPRDHATLVTLPGIGPNTAGAILAYAYNMPTVFVETNIRTVLIHHFFANHQEKIDDAQLRDLVQATLPQQHIREWYWALMDYGAHLKATHGAQLHKVKNYRKQSRFEGSRRQVRGKILRLLVAGPHRTDELSAFIADNRVPNVIAELAAEGLIAPHTLGWQLKQ